jgi:hypothetical protein
MLLHSILPAFLAETRQSSMMEYNLLLEYGENLETLKKIRKTYFKNQVNSCK